MALNNMLHHRSQQTKFASECFFEWGLALYLKFLALVHPETLECMESLPEPEKIKMDRLCELTAKTQQSPGLGRNHPGYPPEDYNRQENESAPPVRTAIKPMVKSTEQTKLQKDLKFNQQRGINLGRPELVKTWEKFESKKTAKEMESLNESELSAKLKTISKKLEEEEHRKQNEEKKPEFMKVNLRKAKPQTAS
ncbi:predicted protein [Nematostella vectensis]|uniref:Uncharacterized protein n=1 Tax=Nematostella vectensis TaxID=45351 RepID=A7S743_NEMVE|nr:predicted protein [Nematostella vectensis]|eukprot:XP_001632494.1 predicted protein [Nematostella vectensis]